MIPRAGVHPDHARLVAPLLLTSRSRRAAHAGRPNLPRVAADVAGVGAGAGRNHPARHKRHRPNGRAGPGGGEWLRGRSAHTSSSAPTENDDPRITHILTDSSQLNTYQYRGGAFYVGGASNQYVTTKSSLTSRKVLAVVGGRDLSVPAEGGASIDIENGEGGLMTFVQWEESALAIATAYGYTGAKATLSPDDAISAKASYLSGQVVTVNVMTLGTSSRSSRRQRWSI